ncbi:MAG: hypothetical protein N4A43_01485, partial [Alphaproteobacteria bacterium]|nr:hypothetical protein [Alphaproteobacteria bacterium]
MRFIITSGSTFTPWDGVRGITNLSKGTTGAKIAEEALLNGHRVDYIANEYAKQPFELRINPSNLGDIKSIKKARSAYRNYTYHKAKTFDDYLKTCLDIPGMDTNEKTVFISSAAVSDYSPKKEKGKVSSNEENISLELGRLPKVIKEVKSKYLLMPVVGFKLLSTETSTLSELIEVAYKSLLDSRLALVVANLVDENFKPTCTVIITPEKNIIPIAKREDLAPKLVELIEQRLDCDFYKTEIAESLPSDIDTKPFLNLIKECSNYALFSSYGDGRKGAEFGSVAMRTSEGILTTGRGTTKSNANEQNIALIRSIDDSN